jgi:uncharacterized protein (TIGR02996 family)
MNEEAGFLAAIAANRQDWTARLVYADWLEERGDLRAAAVRVLATRRILPDPPNETHPKTWNYFVCSPRPEVMLPPDWWDEWYAIGKARHQTETESEAAAVRAFAMLPAARQLALLNGAD